MSPAVEDGKLIVSSPGYKMSPKERVKMLNTEWAYNHPYGQR